MSPSNQESKLNWETLDGSTWASEDEAVARAYAGKWVVAIPGKILASGDDLNVVAQEAAQILGVDSKTIVVQSIVHPDEWFKDFPVCPQLPASQTAG